ncbi:hypothetical protein C6P61_16115 [Malikia spinosa]|uniref:Uncharacterized protein n=1 Tax=Malikia spinosa TaxID=86180 RepID=A0A2S9KAN3_9BURK|nr:hypothetical protein C6P61_16115 [Malikia spinosa]
MVSLRSGLNGHIANMVHKWIILVHYRPQSVSVQAKRIHFDQILHQIVRRFLFVRRRRMP